jgi:hypothetical protein
MQVKYQLNKSAYAKPGIAYMKTERPNTKWKKRVILCIICVFLATKKHPRTIFKNKIFSQKKKKKHQ